MATTTQLDLEPGQSVLAAIMFSDVVSFSRRMGEDEVGTLGLLNRDMKLLTELAEQHDGQVLKSVGDGLMIFFASAVKAVRCAQTFQAQINAQTAQVGPEKSLQHRIGIHLGDIFIQGNDIMGDGVNVAARLQGEAEPGGICISQTVYDVVRNRLALKAVLLSPRELKNIKQSIPIFKVLIESAGGTADGPPPVPGTTSGGIASAPGRHIPSAVWLTAGAILAVAIVSWVIWFTGSNAGKTKTLSSTTSITTPTSTTVTTTSTLPSSAPDAVPPMSKTELLARYSFEGLIDQTGRDKDKAIYRDAYELKKWLVSRIQEASQLGRPFILTMDGQATTIVGASDSNLQCQRPSNTANQPWSRLTPPQFLQLVQQALDFVPQARDLDRPKIKAWQLAFAQIYQLPEDEFKPTSTVDRSDFQTHPFVAKSGFSAPLPQGWSANESIKTGEITLAGPENFLNLTVIPLPASSAKSPAEVWITVRAEITRELPQAEWQNDVITIQHPQFQGQRSALTYRVAGQDLRRSVAVLVSPNRAFRVELSYPAADAPRWEILFSRFLEGVTF